MRFLRTPFVLIFLLGTACGSSAATFDTSSSANTAIAWGAPSVVRMRIPEGLGRPPTSLDVVVEVGFDGKTPEEARALVRANAGHAIHSTNVRFVDESILATHKAVTISMNNAMAARSPQRAFADAHGLGVVNVVGTMSTLHPTYLAIDSDTEPTRYFERDGGAYVEASMRYPIVMVGRVRLATASEGPAVQVQYPAWSAPVLANPTGFIEEL